MISFPTFQIAFIFGAPKASDLPVNNGILLVADLKREYEKRAVQSFLPGEHFPYFCFCVHSQIGGAPASVFEYEKDPVMKKLCSTTKSLRQLQSDLQVFFGERLKIQQQVVKSPLVVQLAADGAPPPPAPPVCLVKTVRRLEEKMTVGSVVMGGIELYKDVLYCIFLRLDSYTLSRCALVCKAWSILSKEVCLFGVLFICSRKK